ncbi:MAG: trehalose-phosphatase [Candidatus Jordarchaeales archaeon]
MNQLDPFTRKTFKAGKSQEDHLPKRLTPNLKDALLDKYKRGKRRLILLDYDGTIVPFTKRPEDAKPDEEILSLLTLLTRDARNEVVIVSGRGKEFLDECFRGMWLGIVAEHGAWIKEKGGEWRLVRELDNQWKMHIRPIMEQYVEATPGSLIEEKSFSLVWHYRGADPKVSVLKLRELIDVLSRLAPVLKVDVIAGNKYVEARSSGVSKGLAALHWLSKENWDFVLAMGDDTTDEEMFAALPSSAYSVKVGLSPSRARFAVESVEEARLLIGEMVRASQVA